MKKISLMILLALVTANLVIPAQANVNRQPRSERNIEKKQRKAQKKYAKAQRKAQRKMIKNSRKNSKMYKR